MIPITEVHRLADEIYHELDTNIQYAIEKLDNTINDSDAAYWEEYKRDRENNKTWIKCLVHRIEILPS